MPGFPVYRHTLNSDPNHLCWTPQCLLARGTDTPVSLPLTVPSKEAAGLVFCDPGLTRGQIDGINSWVPGARNLCMGASLRA